MVQDVFFPKDLAESLSLSTEIPRDLQNVGFMPLLFVQATFPYTEAKEHEFIRKNGNFQLVLYSPSGIPYGSIPRIVIAFLVTEAVRQKSRMIYLGENLTDFLNKLGLGCTGGKNGTITRLRKQLDSLFSCYISCSAIDESETGKIKSIANMVIADKSQLWWEPHSLFDESGKFRSYVRLSESFYNSAISSPIPVDMDIIMKLKKSPMAVDIYCWATYRASYLRASSRIGWEDLALQFGSNYKNLRHFKAHFRKHLGEIKKYYPELKFYDKDAKYLLMYPSAPSVGKKIAKDKDSNKSNNNNDNNNNEDNSDNKD